MRKPTKDGKKMQTNANGQCYICVNQPFGPFNGDGKANGKTTGTQLHICWRSFNFCAQIFSLFSHVLGHFKIGASPSTKSYTIFALTVEHHSLNKEREKKTRRVENVGSRHKLIWILPYKYLNIDPVFSVRQTFWDPILCSNLLCFWCFYCSWWILLAYFFFCKKIIMVCT